MERNLPAAETKKKISVLDEKFTTTITVKMSSRDISHLAIAYCPFLFLEKRCFTPPPPPRLSLLTPRKNLLCLVRTSPFWFASITERVKKRQIWEITGSTQEAA